jgi:hypothetical protein
MEPSSQHLVEKHLVEQHMVEKDLIEKQHRKDYIFGKPAAMACGGPRKWAKEWTEGLLG